MKIFIVLCLCFGAISAQSCHSSYEGHCKSVKTTPNLNEILSTRNCDAIYGNIRHAEHNLKQFTQKQINHSYLYLFMSSYFGNYKVHRKGFEKMFSEMSDKAWEDTIKLVKHMSKRGVHMNNFMVEIGRTPESPELEALSIAVDEQKHLAILANDIIHHKSNPENQDPEITQFIEENFLDYYADKIRELVGYNTDLKRMLKDQSSKALGLEVFDMHLQK